MAIMVAGGLTFAVPSTMPAAYAEVTTSNPHLYVSAEGQDADNQFAQGNIIEVIIRDDSIGDTDEGEAEPDVSINGADLRMLQTANGDWRAYFAQADAIAAIDAMKGELDYGVYCNAIDATSVAEGKVNLRDTNGAYFPPGSVNNTVHDTKCKLEDAPKADPDDPNHPLIRETRDLTNPSTSGLGQLGFADEDLWPFIQVFDFAPESKVNVVYNKGGTQETVTLEFDDPSESHSLDRTKYPQGAHVLVTIEDFALNIDPTDEDTWAFNTDADSKAAYYNLFDEDGNAVNIMNTDITDYAGIAGIGEQIRIDRNPQGGDPLVNCQVTKDYGIQEESNASLDYLVSNDESNGACVPTDNIPNDPSAPNNAHDIFTADAFVIGFVEDGSNNNEFINWADDQRSNLVVRDDAQRNRSFEIDYNDPGAISGVVGHFFAELTLGDAGATWNSGERIGITVTDEDVNTNPLKENNLTVKDPDSLLIPSIRIGSPVTLASATGNVVWYDLENDPEPTPEPTPDTTPPTIAVTGGAFMVSNTTTTAASNYTDAGATCTDTDGTTLEVTTVTPRAVDLNAPGTYTVTYACTDMAGNPAPTMTRTVTVTSDPVIMLAGNPTVTISQDARYIDAGATCADDNDGSIARITHNAGSIDTAQLGTQTITYSCTDMAGNTGTATRTVIVEDKDLPVITILGDNPVTVNQTATYTDRGATCADGDDGSMIPNITNNASAINTTIDVMRNWHNQF